MIALPILWPSALGAALLLFANAFGAIATAYALTGSSFNIAPILLYAQIRGDVLHDPNLGYAMAVGMLAITGLSNLAYLALRGAGAAAMTRGRPGAWAAVALGAVYFLAPLVATFEFSLRMRRGEYSFDAYRAVFASGAFQASFLYSTALALATIVVVAAIVVPTAYFVRLRLPQLARDRRIHHPLAAGDPGDRAGVRLHPPLRLVVHPAAGLDLARRRRAADVRLCRARPALHVSRGRYGACGRSTRAR